MNHPRVPRRSQSPAPSQGVYAQLDDLVRLEFKARGFSFLPRQPIHSILAGRHASRLRGRGLNFEEIRHYLPGDDIRSMDWKVTARMRSPHVRVYTEERDRPVLLLVDQRISMFFGSQRAMKSVVAAEIAALAAWRFLSSGDRVGAIIFDDHHMTVIEPHRSRERVMQILRAVVEKNQSLALGRGLRSNPGMINQVYQRAARLVNHDWMVCSIGDATGADQETVRLATLLTAHNDMMAAMIYDPIESELPEAGRLVVAEENHQLEINSSDRGLRSRYQENFQARLDWIKQMSRFRSIPLIPIHTGEDPTAQIRKHLGHEQQSRRGR
jgi:uncharacterized protein (DUF58 family)